MRVSEQNALKLGEILFELRQISSSSPFGVEILSGVYSSPPVFCSGLGPAGVFLSSLTSGTCLKSSAPPTVALNVSGGLLYGTATVSALVGTGNPLVLRFVTAIGCEKLLLSDGSEVGETPTLRAEGKSGA